MGGSLARALTARAADQRTESASLGGADADDIVVTGWASSSSDRAEAEAAGVNVRGTLDEAVDGADLVVLATPLSAIPALAGALAADLADRLDAHAVVTDVASLQIPALEMAAAAGLGARWISSHPLAGSERSGFEAARADLYDAAPVYLSAAPDSALHARGAVADLWETVGGVPEWVDAAEHDEQMALVSHLPQVASTALADAMVAAGLPVTALGPGGRDVTRLAASSPPMWGDLLAHAHPQLVAALRDVARRLEEDAASLERGDPAGAVARLERARAWRVGTGEVDA